MIDPPVYVLLLLTKVLHKVTRVSCIMVTLTTYVTMTACLTGPSEAVRHGGSCHTKNLARKEREKEEQERKNEKEKRGEGKREEKERKGEERNKERCIVGVKHPTVKKKKERGEKIAGKRSSGERWKKRQKKPEIVTEDRLRYMRLASVVLNHTWPDIKAYVIVNSIQVVGKGAVV